ncbi:unnamed protein product [Allacma fusca]|uniref:Uncharacterized protein n=1 Tax=Allacma fusca TaxID=39272 RepID=A0A8J2KGL0_9HEXA|nr:unnamed protein product [Allacma fusca]
MTFISVKNNLWNKTIDENLLKLNKYPGNGSSFWEEITLGEIIYIIVCIIFIVFYCMFLIVLTWKMLASWRKCWNEVKQQASLQSKRTSVHIQLEYGYNHDGGELILFPIPTRSAKSGNPVFVNEKDLNSSASDLTCRESLYSLNVLD